MAIHCIYKPFLLALLIFVGHLLSAQELIFKLEGTVTDVETNVPVAKALVVAVTHDGVVKQTHTDRNGFYSFGDPSTFIIAGQSIAISVVHKDYLTSCAGENTIGMTQSTALVHDFELMQAEGYAPDEGGE